MLKVVNEDQNFPKLGLMHVLNKCLDVISGSTFQIQLAGVPFSAAAH